MIRDSLLDSLKKDIVIKKEKKIDFMTSMQGENLDLKLINLIFRNSQKLKKFRDIRIITDNGYEANYKNHLSKLTNTISINKG